jgi:hypothetical protein
MCDNLVMIFRIIIFHVLGLNWDILGFILVWIDVSLSGQLGFIFFPSIKIIL